jgi:hypothetical protein
VDGADGIARIYTSVEGPPAGTSSGAVSTLFQSVFQSDTRGSEWTTVSGLGDKAAFRSSTSSLEVLKGVTIYRIQVLSSKLANGAPVLDASKRIFALIS